MVRKVSFYILQKSCNTNSVFTQQEESCLLSHWYQHLHTKAFPTTGFSNLFLSFETIISNGCSSRETHCKTNEGCFTMLCHHWSSHIPPTDYSAFVFFPCLLPTFSQFDTWGKLAQAAAGPGLWQGGDGICCLTSLCCQEERLGSICLAQNRVPTPATLGV